jgi:hypothetical protein
MRLPELATPPPLREVAGHDDACRLELAELLHERLRDTLALRTEVGIREVDDEFHA